MIPSRIASVCIRINSRMMKILMNQPTSPNKSTGANTGGAGSVADAARMPYFSAAPRRQAELNS